MTIESHSYARLFNIVLAGNSSVFIFGPRGVGKTFWIRSNLPKALYLDLLNSEIYMQLQANPTRLQQMIPPNFHDWVVIDEVQKIPALLNEVHRLIESKNIKFLLTGSSAKNLKRKGINLLAGRALTYHMHPFICLELKKDFSLENALKFGLLPKIYATEAKEKYLKTYVTTYLREEILQEGITRNIGEFSRFMEIASFSQGEMLNYSEIAREVAIPRKTVSQYFDIIEDLLIGFRLPVFAKRAKRRMVAHQKFYYFDCGVYRAIRPKGPLDSPDEIDGPALETLFIQHLKAINDYMELGYEFYFWRTSNQVEVDFIAYGEKGLIAFEIKRKRKISIKDLSGLKAFCSDYPAAKAYILYGGNQREYYDGIVAIPFEDALFDLETILKNSF